MIDDISSKILKRFFTPGIALITVILTGTIGYSLIGGEKYSLLDSLYMTVITIATIGYSEIIDMSGNPAGRVFTIFIALAGIGILTFLFSEVTAFIVESELKDVFRRRRMEKLIGKYREHYIICGIEGVGLYIVDELENTKRPYAVVDINNDRLETALKSFPDMVFINGDATDSDILLKAGIKEAKGLFAVTGNDNLNLVISLTAKQLNPDLRVIACCNDNRNIEKIKKAGADNAVSPTFIGGLRIVSDMVRPAVVSFLDTMLRDKEKNLRIEEIKLSDSFHGKTISDLNLKKYSNTLLLAVKSDGDWVYNPSVDYVIKKVDTLIVMTTPDDRDKIEKNLQH